MAYHTPPLKKSGNKGKCHYQASVPTHLENVEFWDGTDGLSLKSWVGRG